MKTYSSQPLTKISNFFPNLHELITLNILDIRLLKQKLCSGNWDADVKIRIMVYTIPNIVPCLKSGNSHQQGFAGLRVSNAEMGEWHSLGKGLFYPTWACLTLYSGEETNIKSELNSSVGISMITRNLLSRLLSKPHNSVTKSCTHWFGPGVLMPWRVIDFVALLIPITNGIDSLLDKL